MSYVVLARKYRPQNFEGLVGQTPVSQTLKNALEMGRVAHAYIFSGPRGVGKTTTARLLAKCLNCVKGITINPCHVCESCISITQGTSMQDVLEIDAASNRGIDDIRAICENARYAPASSRYRIYIIDEAHQITKDAFGALLKTLEEPPAHIIFMLATTEAQKIPAPILSRCQRFALRPIASELVLAHLKTICEKEKIKVEDVALRDIVRFVEGSLRDALSLLDQALVFSPKGITSQTLRDLLGLLPRQVIVDFARTLGDGDPGAILQALNNAIQNGIDLTQLAKDLQDYYHQLLLLKAGVRDSLAEPDPALEETAKSSDFPTLERNIRLLARALDDMRRSDTPRAVFEIQSLRMGQKLLDPRIIMERLEALQSQPPALKTIPQTPNIERPSREGGKDAFEKKRDVASAEPAPLPTSPSQVQKESPGDIDKIIEGWTDFLVGVSEVKQSLGSALTEADIAARSGTLILTFQKSFNQQLAARSLEDINHLLREKFGFAPTLQLKLEPASKAAGTPAISSPGAQIAAPPQPAVAAEQETEFEEIPAQEAGAAVEKALKYFPGTIKRERKK